jgi:hypothetical protein
MPEALDPNRIFEILNDHPYAPRRPLQVGYEENEVAPTDLAAIITGMVPVLGDVLGLGADADMYMRDPESREFFNYVLSAAGLLPFVPAASQVKQGIKAYHGSPHDFDKFSTEQIGTGEGAQQYGHGLYFAESEKVANEYRDQLTPRDLDYEDWLMGKYKAAESTQDYGRMEMYERAMMHDKPQDFKDLAADTDYDDDYRELAAEVGEEIEEYGPNLGSMYEVKIDVEPDELLDYYAPLKDQPKKVQKAIDDLMTLDGVESYSPEGFKVYMKTGVTGETLGHDILNHYNGKVGTKEGVKVLEFAGIKGIRYADAFSRHKSPDKQSMNYVIFDDRLISIAKKYGIAIPVAAALLAKQTGEDPDKMYQEDSSA